MKRALINSLEPGRVCQVVEVGQEFEVADTFSWVDCPDDVTSSHSYNQETNEFVPFDIVAQPGFAENGYKIARSIAYKSIGDQLDMIYKEVMANGSISADGVWAQHVAVVKATIPKDDPAAVQAWNEQYWLDQTSGNISTQ
jgi:hypothetical protein